MIQYLLILSLLAGSGGMHNMTVDGRRFCRWLMSSSLVS